MGRGANHRGGAGRCAVPRGHQARLLSLGGLQRPPPARRGFVCAASLWEGASRGTRWRGKGGIAGALHASQPAPPAPWRGRAPVPRSPRVPGAPLLATLHWLTAACASPRSAWTQAAAENGCQSGASRHAAPGGGRAAVTHPAPFPLQGTLLKPRPSRARGLSGEGEGKGCYLQARAYQVGGDGRLYRKGTFRVPTPTNMSSVLLRSQRPGREMLMWR